MGYRTGAGSVMLGGPNLLRRTQFSLMRTDATATALFGPGLPADRKRDCQLGFDDHLSKPFRHSSLLAMLSHPPLAPDAAALGPVLDPAALARLGELDPSGENRLLERILKAFQTSVARLRPQLEVARHSDDRPTIRLVAHTLKSSSASIGALQLSRLCAQIEAEIRLESTDDLGASLTAFDHALDNALRAIDTLLKERA